MTRIKFISWLLLYFVSCSVFATGPIITIDSLKNIEVSLGVGPNWTHTDNTHLVVSSFETDALRVNSLSNNVLWKLGIGLHVLEEDLQQRNFFNALLIEFNLYRSSSTIWGSVWQYQLPQFNNYNFNAPFTSTRLMLDLKPMLVTWHQISPYLIFGVGLARNNIAYYENITGAGVSSNSANSLAHHIYINTAYDLGVGASIPMTSHLIASLEYLYTNLGDLVTSGTSQAALISSPKFTIYTQAALFSLSWKV
jgi:opacity protein-like surface antigen